MHVVEDRDAGRDRPAQRNHHLPEQPEDSPDVEDVPDQAHLLKHVEELQPAIEPGLDLVPVGAEEGSLVVARHFFEQAAVMRKAALGICPANDRHQPEVAQRRRDEPDGREREVQPEVKSRLNLQQHTADPYEEERNTQPPPAVAPGRRLVPVGTAVFLMEAILVPRDVEASQSRPRHAKESDEDRADDQPQPEVERIVEIPRPHVGPKILKHVRHTFRRIWMSAIFYNIFL